MRSLKLLDQAPMHESTRLRPHAADDNYSLLHNSSFGLYKKDRARPLIMVGVFKRILRTIQQAAAKTRALPGGDDELPFYGHEVIIIPTAKIRKCSIKQLAWKCAKPIK